jgi:RNA polymerase sigma-70 factor (ECF subfamily)
MVEDEQIMRQVRDGEVGRLEVLFDRHHRALLHYFLHVTGDRATSEDLVQEVFFRVLKYRRSYQTENTFRGWLFQIGRNAYLDHLARRKNEAPWPAEAPEAASRDAAPDRLVEDKQEAALLRQALADLAPEKREVLVMSRFLDLKYEEIAAALQCEVGTVKVRVYRALHELGDRFFALRGETL